MATRINPDRFDLRRRKLARELAASLTAEERQTMALVMGGKVGGRWTRGRGVMAATVQEDVLRRGRVVSHKFTKVTDEAVLTGIASLIKAGWLRFAEHTHDHWGHFWTTMAADDIVTSGGLTSSDFAK